LAALKTELPSVKGDFWLGAPEAVARELVNENVRKALYPALELLARHVAGVSAVIAPDELIVYSPIFSKDNLLWRRFAELMGKEKAGSGLGGLTVTRAIDADFLPAIGAAFAALERCYPTSDLEKR
jgi:hypothetical protein